MSANDLNAAGTIIIKDISEATFIDVDSEVVGKRFYKSSNGISLSNGMKVEFTGQVEPVKYANEAFYVEGVGDKIKLIAESDLNVPTAFTEDIDVEFDAQGFDRLPYSKAIGYPEDKDYFVINRASNDGNLWSRYNRWFHKSVIELAAQANNQPIDINQLARAKRPIIEFEPNLKLHEFGTKSKKDVDLVDDFTTDVFSTIEGSPGYNIDGVDIVDGMRILFTADTDPLVTGKIFDVKFINFASGAATNRQIHLTETTDSTPVENEVVLISAGTSYKGKLLYYTNNSWKRTQDKTSANQAPLFDIFDENGNSYSDTSVYESTTFTGNKIFSYKQGTGTADSEIGIPITYRKISNVGDIVFDFNLVQGTITYTADNNAFSKATDTGFLRKYLDLTAFETLTGWKKVTENSEQVVIQQVIYDNTINDFEIDVYDNSGSLTDLWVRVYRNNVLQFKDVDYTINTNIQGNAQVTFNNTLVLDDVILIKTRSAATKNDNGYYEIPVALERNPKNENLTEFTLGAVNDHVSTIVEQSDEFSGVYPGVSNLRDVGNVTALGRRFLQHSVPLNLPLYHSTDNNSNIVKSIEYASKEYSVFKRLFLQKAEDLGFQGAIKDHVDKILQDINKDKTKSQPFFFSDMVPIGATKKTTRIIDDVDDLYFPLSSMFSLTSASRKAVQIYINGVQLVHNKDYTFNSEGYALITATKQQDDVVDIYEYETTNGSYVPPTPTKLGLYPAYEPVKYTDNTYLESQQVIQGHDGSKIIAFNDYRDDILLELERRIYNNIKVSYDSTLFDIHSLVGGDFRNTGVTKSFIDKTILGDFISWSKFIDQDYTLHNFFERTNRFTFNYTGSQNKQDVLLPGFWREVYKQAFDTDRPHTHPWEMLGFSVKPTWWETQYGPAPYTKENTLLWQDLEDGVVREPNKKFKVLNNYKRPGLTGHIPADSNGNLLSPLDAGYVKFFDPTFIDQSFIFGDGSPVESAWRSSSQYPFSIVKAFAINKPAQLFATGFDRINQVKNIANEIVYKPTQKRFQLKDIVFPNTSEDTTQVYTSGIVNYISNYMSTSVLDLYKEYKENITTINNQLGYKLSGFTDKEKFKLILDSRTPTNQGNVFVPFENYKIFLNTSSPTKIVSYSGVIIERRSDGYVVKGYDTQASSFTYYQTVSTQRDPSINIGGISESFLIWDSNKNYVAGANVEYQGSYYRVKEAHTSTGSFDNTKFAKLASLPLIGGRDAFVRKQFNKNIVLTADYGKIFAKIQDVVDFLLGYGEYLKDQGFVFDYYEGEEKILTDWRHSVNEFLFWTTQKWGEGSVITLSPASKQIKFVSQYNMVANVFGGEYGYTLLQSDGTPLVEEFSSVGRSPNEFILTPKNTAEGIFAIKLPLIQKEHVLLIDNKTVFGDIIYDTQPGYRQERIKVLGYITQDWDGSLNIPGFVYDDATVTNWEQWTDYAIGDIVKYKEFYYSAIKKLSGKENFDAQEWHRLDDKPEAGLYTNFDYKVNQFSDFYDLDSDNFDTEQQKVAQHLIGYQKRQYLENIVNDDVSQYKFYQGMLQDKGTKNALTKLFDVLSSADKDSLEFYEEWAIKDGQYGAAEGFEEFELLLDESKFRLSPQPIELVNSTTGNETDLVYRILPYEVYQKTKNYNHQPFPALNVNKSYIKDAGYVNQADVRGIATTYRNLADYNISDIKRGQYVWVGNDNLNWNVYKHVDTDYIVESIEAGSTEFNITLTTNVTDIIVDDVIGMSNVGNTTLDKFYIVSKVDKNVITLVTSSAVQEIAECKGNITKFLSVRSASIPDANTVLQKNLDEGDLHWIDNFNGNWSVIKNTNNFTEQLKVQKDSSAVDLSYATSMAVDSRNTTLVVGAPDENDGKVYIYTRASDSINFVQSQVIEPVKYGNDLERFGAGLDISPDGDFIIVGSPDASNVKTKYEGSFVATDPYPKGSIVSSNQQLWRSVVDIQPQVANVVYNSFDSVTDVIDQLNVENLNTVDIPMLLTGNYAIDTVTNQYAFQNVVTDHILIRAPLDIYRGIGLNDTVKLAWNSITYSNQSLAALAQQAPFAGSFPSITEAYLDAGHVVQKKIDVILYVNSSTNLVELNDIVQTETGSGTVDYVYNEGAELVIYLKDVNGSFNSLDSLFRNDGDFIGQYEKQGPTDSVDTSTELGGFLYITAPSYTPTSATTNKDQGRGLIFADVIRPSESSNRYYYNILDFDSAVLDSQNTFNSYIRVLSSQGLPGAFGNNSPILSDLYVVRAPKPVTDVVNQGDTINFYVNQLPQYGTGIIKDITALNLTTTITNKLQTIYDVWDGYINFDFTKFDSSGNPFEPKVGQSVEDKTTGATGVVTYYQRDGLNATIFIKSVTGVWSKGDDYGQNAEIEFKLIPGDPNPTYQADRIIGQIQFVSLGLPADNIGKMLVFQNATNLSVPTGIDYITDAEYWFYQQDNVNGIPRPANAPSAINNEWEQTYKIPTDITGTASGLTNEGIYAIYSKTTFGRYDLISSYTVPEKATNYKLGSSIKITKNNDLYRGMIGAAGNGTTSLPGKIYFIKKGTENNIAYNWDYAKNKKFKGTFDESLNYFTDDIVYVGGVLYVAKTNVAPGAFDANDWTSTDDLVDYVGYIPNSTGLSVSDGNTVLDQAGLVDFGSEFDVANSGEVLITNAMYNDSTNKVVVYRANNGHFERSQEIDAPDITSGFGHALALSNDGTVIAISAPYNDNYKADQGIIYIYKQVNGVFEIAQTLKSPNNEQGEKFGWRLDFDGDQLFVSAKDADMATKTIFDSGATILDQGFTAFNTINDNAGVVYVYEKVKQDLIFAQTIQIPSTELVDPNINYFGNNILARNNHFYVGLPNRVDGTRLGNVIDFKNNRNENIWQIYRSDKPTVDLNKIKKMFLYNTKDNELLTYIDYIDPIQGKVAGIAEQDLTYKTYYDPALYDLSSTGQVIDPTNSWGEKHVGEVWWDLTNAKFFNPYQGDVVFSTQNWSKIFQGNIIDVYEWVQSPVIPSEWDAQADTENGFAKGFSGTSLYGDATYSTRKIYDGVAKIFKTNYYFWVKNKKTVPDVEFRNTSIFDIADYIQDPIAKGYTFAALISPSQFVLYNAEKYIKGTEVALSTQYWTIPNQTQNIHNQYQIISEGLETSQPNNDIVRKWFDSLSGYDEQDRIVPDPYLSPKQKYGALNKPRQSWFKNRYEALKQFIERTNLVLSENLIVDDKIITSLNKNDPEPTVVSNLYDVKIDTLDDLGFVGVAKASQAVLTPVVVNGKITNVLITDPGRGYRNAPLVTVTGLGSGAVLQTTIDALGKVSSVTILESGENYSDNVILTVRPFTVLVSSDNTILGKWALYERDTVARTWNRVKSQAYDTKLFWDYKDWYATGYSEVTDIDYLIDNAYELTQLDAGISNVVKISNIGSGGWLLLEKIDSQDTEDYTINYKTIGRQNGTIKFNETLYDSEAAFTGFDTISFDTKIFDSEPRTELRIILNTIKDNLFIDDLQVKFNELFFASLRYAFSEQTYIDWAFKTSFIKAKHNVGSLRKDITFNNDSLPSYEAYIKEVKPFGTKIREYLSAYEGLDNTQTVVTDFDLPASYSVVEGKIVPQNVKVQSNTLVGTNADIETYPNKNWLDNSSYKVVKVTVVNQGSGYFSPPVLKVSGGGGSGVELETTIGTNGKVTGVKIVNAGSGFYSAPTIESLDNISDTGEKATYSIQIGDSPVRGLHTSVKFDRTTGTYVYTNLNKSETFVASGSKFEYDLSWPMDLDKSNIKVYVNNVEALDSEYTFTNKLDVSKGYDRYFGQILFVNLPKLNETILIEYKLSSDIMQAQDRINNFIPKNGNYVTDLKQLMTGLDYGGVEVKSFEFEQGRGFDSGGDTWDSYDETFEDEIFELDDSTTTFTFAKVLETGVQYHVYKNNVRIDDPNYPSAPTNPNAVIQSITGAGQTGWSRTDDGTLPTDLVVFDEEAVSISNTDIIIFRKSTSDGTYLPEPNSYDTLIKGGALNYSTATGISAADINIDGDGFVTPTTSAGPEELVPGQVLDTLDIKVYERPSDGSSKITSRNYTGDGTTTVFNFGAEVIQQDSLFVKINYAIIASTEYTIDYNAKTITFNTAPIVGSKIHLAVLGVSGTKIIDIDNFVADGSTARFLTNVRFADNLQSVITLDGQKLENVVVKSRKPDGISGNALIKFATPPAAGSVINFAFFEGGDVQNYSEVGIQNFTLDGSTVSYALTTTPFTATPVPWQTIVKVNDIILNAGYTQKFTMAAATREYQLDNFQIPPGSVNNKGLQVFINGKKLTYLQDWTFTGASSSAGSSIVRIKTAVGHSTGDILDVYLVNDGQYAFGYIDAGGEFVDTPGTIYLDSAYNENDVLTVYQFSNHDSQRFERQQLDVISRVTLTPNTDDWYKFNHLTAGLIELPTPAIDAEYVWITINGQLLLPSIQYQVTDNKKYVKINIPIAQNDVIELIHFAETQSVNKYGWSQFKDMLNRTHYKRLDDTAGIQLVTDLNWYDQKITISDGSTLPIPDATSSVPGVIFIGGERIEYFVRNDNVLSQLRRGTLGTGVKDTHIEGTTVFNSGLTSVMPYKDETLTTQFIADGISSTYTLDFVASSINEFEVFVGGKRLRKNAISSYVSLNPTYQDSPEGDVTLPAEFSVNGSTLTLTTTPTENVKVTVVRRSGIIWTNPGTQLSKADSDIARFLRDSTVDLPR